MSKQQVIAFFKAAAQSEALSQKLSMSKHPASILLLATEHGYTFTEQDLFAVKREQMHAAWAQIEELSEQQLESIAGGGRRGYGGRVGFFASEESSSVLNCDDETVWCTLTGSACLPDSSSTEPI